MAQTKKNNSKMLIIIGLIIVLLFVAIIALTKMSNSNKLENNPYGTDDLQQSTIDLLDDENYQNIILPNDLDDKIASGEKVYAYLFSPECPHCQNFTPKLMPIAKDMGIHIDQLNLLEYNDQSAKYSIEYTPTLIVFENGEEVTRLVGDHDETSVKSFFNSVQ